MSRIICAKCGLEGWSKCPGARSIFSWEERVIPGCGWPEDKIPVGHLDTAFSHRLGIQADKLQFTVYDKVEPPETPEEAFHHLWSLLQVPWSVAKTFVCEHRWEFAPFERCEIHENCGSEEKPLLDYMSDAWYYLTDGVDVETSRYPHGDADDKAAAQIIHDALTAIDEGKEKK